LERQRKLRARDLISNLKIINFVKRDHSAGIVPSKLFEPNDKPARFVNTPISLGSVEASELRLSVNVVNAESVLAFDVIDALNSTGCCSPNKCWHRPVQSNAVDEEVCWIATCVAFECVHVE
jgi:hypothetical protein